MNHLTVGGARIAYRDTGTPAPDAPTLLLAHGFPLSHAMWEAQAEALAENCRVVAPDLRGFGESGLGDWPGDASPSLDRYADDLAALIAALAPAGPVTLAGFSMGGYVALAMSRRHPEAFDRLVLIDTKATADSDEAHATRHKMADHVHEWGSARVAALMRPNLFAEGTPEEIVNRTVKVIAATDPAAIAAAQRAMAARPDSTELLPGITKPTLVVVGEEDTITPPEVMIGMANAIPGAAYAEIPGAGHMAPVEQPGAVTAALRDFATA